jgi:predicted DNA-binding transcriptional regulator YafY
MLLLQSRGKMSVAELRKELEVSERTVYRDLVALDSAGVPIVTERGPGGGCYLVEGYTTRLTGLTEEEARALFASGTPGPYESLGMGRDFEGALLKLAASLPPRLKGVEARARGRIYLAPQEAESGGVLETLREAVLGSRRVRLRRRFPFGPVAEARLEQELAALGLVSTGRAWLLVGRLGPAIKVIEVSDIVEVEPLGEDLEAGDGFDLAAFWEEEGARRKSASPPFVARLGLAPEAAPYLRPWLGGSAESKAAAAKRGPDGLAEIELGFSSLEEALLILPGLGGAVRALEPELLRLALADRARACLLRNAAPRDEGKKP